MTDEFVDHVRFGGVERTARVPDVLGGEEDAVGEERQERPRGDESRHREHAEPGERPDAGVHVLELGDPGAVERHGIHALEVLGAGEVPVPRVEKVPDVVPDGVLLVGVGDGRGRVARDVVEGEFGDGVPAGAVPGVPEAGMVGVERNEFGAAAGARPRLVGQRVEEGAIGHEGRRF